MKKHTLAVLLLLACMSATAFAADTTVPPVGKDASGTVDKAHKKGKKAFTHKKKTKETETEKDKAK